MKIAIIDYGAGNLQSVKFAFEKLGANCFVTSNPEEIRNSDRIVFPGVGEAKTAMQRIKAKGLDRIIPELQQPVLGICLGMQLLCKTTDEGNTKGLGIFNAKAIRISDSVKVPHMGWNTISDLKSPLFKDISTATYMYFVHSYSVEFCVETIAQTDYAGNFSAALNKNNFYGCQFHPEKSGEIGQIILKNFIAL